MRAKLSHNPTKGYFSTIFFARKFTSTMQFSCIAHIHEGWDFASQHTKAKLSVNSMKRCFCYEHGNYRMADMTLGACVETRRGWYERPLNARRKEKECFQTDKRDDFKVVVPNSGDSRDGCAQTQSEGCPVDTMGPRVSLKWRVACQSISRHSFAILVGFPCADIT